MQKIMNMQEGVITMENEGNVERRKNGKDEGREEFLEMKNKTGIGVVCSVYMEWLYSKGNLLPCAHLPERVRAIEFYNPLSKSRSICRMDDL